MSQGSNVSNEVPRVESPFLAKNGGSAQPRMRSSLEKLERINMNDLEPFSERRNNRLSREIIGLDAELLSAPDRQANGEQNKEADEDAGSTVFGGSVTSTVPDRYGFTGGAQYTHQSEKDILKVEVVRRREAKWLQMLDQWDHYMQHKYKKVRNRCRKGIPSAVRPRAWLYLCGAYRLKRANEGVFESLLEQPGDPVHLNQIRVDLNRQFPLHEMFADSNGPGQGELFRVLKAYTILNPTDGYCQGQGPLAAMLLMHMPAEEAFWCLVIICDRYMPGYYSEDMVAVQQDGEILMHLLKKVCPSVHRHLTKQKLDPVLFMVEWFMCVYTRTLPWSSVLRVWDMFFFEGVKVLFLVGLVVLKYTFIKSRTMKECSTMYESLELLRHLHPSVTEENALVSRMLKLPVTEEDFDKTHVKVEKLRKARAAAAAAESANPRQRT